MLLVSTRKQGRWVGLLGLVLIRAMTAALATVVLVAVAAPALALKEEKLVTPNFKKPKKGTKANFTADNVHYDPATKIAIATGDVKIKYGKFVLRATRVTFNQATGEFTANGEVKLREPNGNIMYGETLELRQKFKEVFATHVTALMTNHTSIKADYVRRDVNGISIFTNARYTACTNCTARNGEPLWEVVTDQTTLDTNEDMVHHVNPRLKVAGHTVIGVPRYSHPGPGVKRKTGFLRPSYKFGEAYGLRAITPYYWAPERNYDLTISPAISSKQGPVGDFEWRHRTTTGQYRVQGFGVYQLQPSKTKVNENWRGAVKTDGKFKLDDAGVWKWGWHGVLASDKYFLGEYDFDNRGYARNDVYLTGLWDRNYVSAQAIQYKSLSNIDQDRLPTALPFVSGEHYFNDPIFGGELKFNWNSYNLSRAKTDLAFIDVNHAQRQFRAVGDLRWSNQMISNGGLVVTPFARLRTDLYFNDELTVGAGEQTTTRILPSGGIDMRYPLIGSLGAGQSIITPVAQIIAARDEIGKEAIGNEDAITLSYDTSSLFLDDRFTGLDRYEGGTRANIGLNYTHLGADGGTFKASLGESFHIAGANSFTTGSGLDGSRSDIVGAFNWRPNEYFSIGYEARVEEDFSAINRQELNLGLISDRFSSKLSYLFINAEPAYGRTKDEEWIKAASRIGLTEGWYLFGGVGYDLAHDVYKSRVVGIEFDCDCMNFKVAYTAKGGTGFVTGITEHSLMMSIDFATLGGTSFTGRYKP